MRILTYGMLIVSFFCASATFADPGRSGAKKRYGVGILGNCTTHGAGLFRMFDSHPDTFVAAAYEKNPRRFKELAKCGAPMVGSYSEVINHPDVQFVGISCDPCDKAEMVEKAAAAGKHIFLNKPLCESLNSARRIQAAVNKSGVQFVFDIPMVRACPAYAKLLEEVQSGRYGKVMGYHHVFGMNFAPDFPLEKKWPERLDPPAKSGGGEMANMGCYAIDYAISLFGMPKTVTAKWRKTWDVYKKADVENFGQIILDYGDFYAFLEVGKQQLVGERRNSNSMFINFEHTALLIDDSAKFVTVNHIPRDWATYVKGVKVVGSVDQLLAAIEKGTPPSSNVDTAVQGIEVLMAAYQSIVSDGKAIVLPLASEEHPLVAAGRK